MRIFIVNGPPGSGKTTFEEYASQIYRECGYITVVYSSIDFVKELALECGWDGTKTPRNRKFLSDLKKLLTDWNDVPLRKIMDRLDQFQYTLLQYECDPTEGVAFIDIREPEEIKKACKVLNAKSILVTRGDIDAAAMNSNESDENVYDYDYDYIIDNNGNLDDLYAAAQEFIIKDLA